LRVTSHEERDHHDWTMEELCELLPLPISSTQGVEKNLAFKALDVWAFHASLKLFQ
jgi:hypothetical protein